MIRTQVFLTEDQYHNIRLQAEREKKPASKVIRDLLDEGFDQRRQQAAQSVLDGLIKLSQVGASGPKDLSSRIDDYLYDDK